MRWLGFQLLAVALVALLLFGLVAVLPHAWAVVVVPVTAFGVVIGLVILSETLGDRKDRHPPAMPGC
jgi:hypothetical protein